MKKKKYYTAKVLHSYRLRQKVVCLFETTWRPPEELIRRLTTVVVTNANRALLRPHQHRACKAFVRRILESVLEFYSSFSARADGWARFDEARRSVTPAGKVHCALDAAAAESSCFLRGIFFFFPHLAATHVEHASFFLLGITP